MQADKKSDEIPSKNSEEIPNISYTGLVLNLILTLFKLLSGFLGNSNLLLTDSIRSFSEFINRWIRLLDFFIASKPEEKSHNYGHGKVITLCMGAGAFILLFASFCVSFLSSGELKTRRIGKGIGINACVRVNNSLSICEAAEIAGFVEERLKKAFGEDIYINIKIEPSPEKIPNFKNKGKPSEESKREKVTLF